MKERYVYMKKFVTYVVKMIMVFAIVAMAVNGVIYYRNEVAAAKLARQHEVKEILKKSILTE